MLVSSVSCNFGYKNQNITNPGKKPLRYPNFNSLVKDSITFKGSPSCTISELECELKGQLKPLFSNDIIQKRVAQLAEQINHDYGNEGVYVICVLNGAKNFADDLTKQMGRRINGFVKLKSMDGAKSSGKITLVREDLPGIEKAKHILVIEDLVDSGLSMDFYMSRLKGKYNPSSLKLAALLDKPNARAKGLSIKPDYKGFDISKEFVVGYGLDYNEKGRELDTIYQVVSREN